MSVPPPHGPGRKAASLGSILLLAIAIIMIGIGAMVWDMKRKVDRTTIKVNASIDAVAGRTNAVREGVSSAAAGLLDRAEERATSMTLAVTTHTAALTSKTTAWTSHTHGLIGENSETLATARQRLRDLHQQRTSTSREQDEESSHADTKVTGTRLQRLRDRLTNRD